MQQKNPKYSCVKTEIKKLKNPMALKLKVQWSIFVFHLSEYFSMSLSECQILTW